MHKKFPAASWENQKMKSLQILSILIDSHVELDAESQKNAEQIPCSSGLKETENVEELKNLKYL